MNLSTTRALAAISAVTFGSTLLVSAVAPASASVSAHPAYNQCPQPSPEPSPIVRMITVLEHDVMNMLGIAQPGCGSPG